MRTVHSTTWADGLDVCHREAGPIGTRLARAMPERVAELVLQNALAHDEGPGPLDAAMSRWMNAPTRSSD